MKVIAKPAVNRMCDRFRDRFRDTWKKMEVIAKPRVGRIRQCHLRTWLTMMWGSSSQLADRDVQRVLYFLAFFPNSFERKIACLTQNQKHILIDMIFIAMDRIDSNLCAGGLTKSSVMHGIAMLTVKKNVKKSA